MSTNIKQFLTSFTQDSSFFIHNSFLWSVNIDGINISDINAVLDEFGEKWHASISPYDMTIDGNLIVAQRVGLPNESSSFSTGEMSSTGNYLPGYVLDKRSNFLERSFNIDFLETQQDIEHNFFRPWMIAIASKGLIAAGRPLKSTIEVNQYTNGGDFMKGFRFRNAFPTSIEAFSLDYDSSNVIIKSVTFACQNYEQI